MSLRLEIAKFAFKKMLKSLKTNPNESKDLSITLYNAVINGNCS